jgi:hypothetical protein
MRRTKAEARKEACAVRDHQCRTAILLRREKDKVVYLPMAEGCSAFRVHRESAVTFDARYKLLPKSEYPITRAAAVYLGYAVRSGGTHEVVDELARLIRVSPEDRAEITRAEGAAPVRTRKSKFTPKEGGK